MEESLREKLRAIDVQIAELEEERRKIFKASLDAPEEEKVCADYVAEELSEPSPFPEMEFPIEVTGINWLDDKRENECFLVRVRPAKENETYLGVYVGCLPLGMSMAYHEESGVLSAKAAHYNPAIVVPALGRIVMGCESWWGKIRSEKDLEDISDGDIDNVWYVKALKGLAEKKK
jgi:hypothetical protein